MRGISNSVKVLLNTDDVSIYYLVSIKGEDINLKHTTLPYDVTIDGLGTFFTNNSLMSVESPVVSAVVDREIYKITYADPDFTWREVFDTGITGATVTVYVGFMNSTDSTIGNAAPGTPLKHPDDFIVAYKGFVDSQGHVTESSGEIKATIECASPMADLDLKKSFYTSKQGMAQFDAADTSFDQVFEGSQSVDLLWGKIKKS